MTIRCARVGRGVYGYRHSRGGVRVAPVAVASQDDVAHSSLKKFCFETWPEKRPKGLFMAYPELALDSCEEQINPSALLPFLNLPQTAEALTALIAEIRAR